MVTSSFRRVELAEYQALLNACQILERDAFGAKVLVTPDGRIVKLFRRKRWLSTALLQPYALRFIRNARRLAAHDILSVQVLDAGYCPAAARHLVTYQPLPGSTLRQTLTAADAERPLLIDRFAGYVATLHQKGVYFRSLHFGNVIVSVDQRQLGLIDVANMNFCVTPLSVRQRLRNFCHMLRYRVDQEFLHEYGWPRFVNDYLAAAGLPPRDAELLRVGLQRLAPPLLTIRPGTAP